MQSNLKPGLHCTHITTKANARAKLLLKSFLSHDATVLTHAFTTFVRPILEYATPVWSSHFKCSVDLVESTQRRFTHKLFQLCKIAPASYDDRLRLLGIHRTIRIWNSLPDSCFMPDSFSAFKYKICKMTFADYLIGSK